MLNLSPGLRYLDQAHDRVAVALALAAHGPEAVDHGRLQPDQAFVLLVDLVLIADGAEREAAMASNAAWLIAMRIMPERA
jgi:hypothetical protein